MTGVFLNTKKLGEQHCLPLMENPLYSRTYVIQSLVAPEVGDAVARTVVVAAAERFWKGQNHHCINLSEEVENGSCQKHEEHFFLLFGEVDGKDPPFGCDCVSFAAALSRKNERRRNLILFLR